MCVWQVTRSIRRFLADDVALAMMDGESGRGEATRHVRVGVPRGAEEKKEEEEGTAGF